MTGVAEQISIAKRIQDLLGQLNQTQAWLADNAKVERSTVSRLLRGERVPSMETLQYLAPVLGLKVEELVRGTDLEPRMQDAPSHVSREAYEGAVKRMLEYEAELREQTLTLRQLSERIEREEARRKQAEQAAQGAYRHAEGLERRLLDSRPPDLPLA